MKLYSIAFFLVVVNISIAFLVNAVVLPVHIQTISITETDFSSAVPDKLSYSNADIGLYLFGDFPRAIGMLAKLFVFAPITLSLLMGECGLPWSIVSLISICMWIVYLVGIAQIIMKFSLEGNA